MMGYLFLRKEVHADLRTAHDVYRAVRAIARLEEEGEIGLTPKEREKIRRYEWALRQFYDPGEENPQLLPLTTARQLIAKMKGCVPFGEEGE